MRWFLEHIQVVIAIAGVIAWWVNQRRREKAGEAADYDGDGTPERNTTAEQFDDEEQSRRVREDIRRKIAERRGQAAPATTSTEQPAAQTDRPREEAPPPVFQDPLQDMLKELQKRLAPIEEPAAPPPLPAIDQAALERQQKLDAEYRELEARRARTLAQAEAIRTEEANMPQHHHHPATGWLAELRDAKNMRRAIITRELIGPPVGLR